MSFLRKRESRLLGVAFRLHPPVASERSLPKESLYFYSTISQVVVYSTINLAPLRAGQARGRTQPVPPPSRFPIAQKKVAGWSTRTPY